MFPISDTRQGYLRQTKQLERLTGAPDQVVELIDSLQPYHSREKGLDHTIHPLWVLNKLENIDKHRRLTLASAIGRQAHISISYPDGGETDLLHLDSVIYDRAVLMSYPPDTGGGEVQMSGYLAAYVALRETDELPSLLDEPIRDVLLQLIDYVGNQLLPRFRRLATGHKVAPKRRRRQDLRPKLKSRPRGR